MCLQHKPLSFLILKLTIWLIKLNKKVKRNQTAKAVVLGTVITDNYYYKDGLLTENPFHHYYWTFKVSCNKLGNLMDLRRHLLYFLNFIQVCQSIIWRHGYMKNHDFYLVLKVVMLHKYHAVWNSLKRRYWQMKDYTKAHK